MKKIVSIILLSTILLTGNITFAQGSTLFNAKNNITQNDSDKQAKLAEIAPLRETIRTNRTKILSLRAEARDAYNKAKNHIKELIKNMDNLTPEQIESIKASISVIQKDKQVLAGTIGEILKETLDLRTAKEAKNFQKIIDSLKSIIAIQTTRIEDLQRIIDDLNKAAII